MALQFACSGVLPQQGSSHGRRFPGGADVKIQMNYLSVCSGIEAASVAWHPLGWLPVAFSEIEPFPRAVLAHRFQNVPNLGDMTKHENWKDRTGPIDLLVGGTPCQAFSVAGLRKGLADPRGNLTLTFLAIAQQYRPRWVVWENVPGVLSDRTGAFGSLLGGLAELGYGWSYRILDAQYYGVAQRRRRVFVVGYLGDWSRAAAVLFERESLCGHPPPSRGKGKAAPTIPSRSTGGGGLGTDFDCDGGLIPEVAGCLSCLQERDSKGADSDTKPGHLIPVPCSFKPSHYTRGKDGSPAPVVPPLSADADKGDQESVVMFEPRMARTTGGQPQDDISHCLRADNNSGDGMPCVASPSMQVRRLTPRECERLQGFPDDWTLVPHRGKPACDGPRYKAIGNSMAVPVMRWIGRRIQMVDGLL